MYRSKVYFCSGILVMCWCLQVAISQSVNSWQYPAFFNGETWQVRDVVALPTGQVWVATDGGIAAFDGNEFISQDWGQEWGSVYQLTLTPDSTVWLLAAKGIYRLSLSADAGTFTPHLMMSGTFSVEDQIFVDDQQTLWVSTQTGTTNLISGSHADSHFVISAQLTLQKGPKGRLWGVSPRGVIYLSDTQRDRFTAIARAPKGFDRRSIGAISDTHLLLGGKGLYEFTWLSQPQKGRLHQILEGVGRIDAITPLSKTKILLSADSGVYIGNQDQGQWRFHQVFNQQDQHRLEDLPFKGVNRFFVNRHGQIWAAANNGLGLMHISFWQKPMAMTNINVWQISVAGPNEVYANSGNTHCIRRQHDSYSIHEIVSMNGLTTGLCFTSSGIWVSDINGQIVLVRPDSSQRRWNFSKRGGAFFNIHQTRKGGIWACQAPRDKPIPGIIRVSPQGDPRLYGPADGLVSRALSGHYDAGGNYYVSGIGPTSYLYRYDSVADHFDNLSLPLPFPSNPRFEVHQLAMDPQGDIWMASTDGLLRYTGSEVLRIKVNNWPLNEEIRGIYISKDGALWLSSRELGLVYWQGDTIVHYGEESGLPAEQMTYRCLVEDNEGYLWVGTREGLVVSQTPFPKPLPSPTPHWEKIWVNKQPFSAPKGEQVRLPYLSDLTLAFGATGAPADGLRFQGRIPMLETPWIDLDPTQGWILSSLQAGTYTLELRARNTIGTTWSQPIQYTFTIQEVWYKRSWAIVLFFILAGGMVGAGIFFRNQQLNATNKRLESLVEERTQKLVHALEAKNSFMANMSHEIRTPMHGVIATLELMTDTPLTVEQKEYLGIIRHSSQSLLTIINDILDLSKVESGKMELEAIPFHLTTCIEQVLLTFASKAAEKSLELTYEIVPSTPLQLIGDPIRISQIINNLLNNAIKFTHQGGVHIAVAPKTLPQTDDSQDIRLQIQVIDSGIGIPAEKQPQLFEAFSQADTTITRKYGGTGLGLTIVKHLVQLMDGQIGVQSQVGIGTTFTFDLRLQMDAKAAPAPWDAFPSTKQLWLIGPPSRSRDWLATQAQAWGITPHMADELPLPDTPNPIVKFDYLIMILQEGQQALPTCSPLAESQVPTLLVAPINHLKAYSTHSPDWVTDFMAMPIRKQALYDWFHQGQQAERQVPQTSLPLSSSTPSVYPLQILLAEDNDINKKLALRIFQKIGYQEVDWVGNGREALKAVTQKRYDLVFMDVMMPEMDGRTATRQIRSQLPSDHQPIIIALTASALKADMLACEEAGMDDFLSKPFRQHELIAILDKWGKVLI